MAIARISFILWTIFMLITIFSLSFPIYGKVIYVDDGVTGANDGSSWMDAYNYLQDALTDAKGSEKPVEIRVAQGSTNRTRELIRYRETVKPHFN